ncbi:MAG: hypothetical protein ABI217_08395 [Chthoniobacterales bacterium]
MMNLGEWRIDYQALIHGAKTIQEKRNRLGNGITDLATAMYKTRIRCPTLIDEIKYGSFWYGFDNYSWLELKGKAPLSEAIDDRVVFVVGSSAPLQAESAKRASSWLRGLIGPTGRRFGPQYDKGHFMARSNGGGSQLNIFPQRRDLNRAWSNEGKLFRQMETYCHHHPKTLCFSRPIYLQEALRPDAFDFGLLKQGGELWVAQFDKQEIPEDGGMFQNRIPKGKELNAWRDALRRAGADSKGEAVADHG